VTAGPRDTGTAPVDPRVALALSILDHARDQPRDIQNRAIDRALLALRGATLEEILEVSR
jgi:hypothetical protein